MMVTRRNAISQVIGFMSIENGLILAAQCAGHAVVVEISIAFSVLGCADRDRVFCSAPGAFRHRRCAGAHRFSGSGHDATVRPGRRGISDPARHQSC